jgi:hypothetical protein
MLMWDAMLVWGRVPRPVQAATPSVAAAHLAVAFQFPIWEKHDLDGYPSPLDLLASPRGFPRLTESRFLLARFAHLSE